MKFNFITIPLTEKGQASPIFVVECGWGYVVSFMMIQRFLTNLFLVPKYVFVWENFVFVGLALLPQALFFSMKCVLGASTPFLNEMLYLQSLPYGRSVFKFVFQ